jgi:hypothetical protein
MARREYGNEYPSVTTILGVLRKIGLEIWFKNNTPEFIKQEGEKGKLIGTQIHEAIQNHIEENKVKIETKCAEEIMNALNSFMLFKKENPKIALERAELQLTSEKYKYNGTMDCLGNDSECLALFDWKTGTCKEKDKPPIYDEFRYQVAGYVPAYNETHEKKISRAYILVLAKDKTAYNLEMIGKGELQEIFEEVFLPALKICYYQKGGR